VRPAPWPGSRAVEARRGIAAHCCDLRHLLFDRTSVHCLSLPFVVRPSLALFFFVVLALLFLLRCPASLLLLLAQLWVTTVTFSFFHLLPWPLPRLPPMRLLLNRAVDHRTWPNLREKAAQLDVGSCGRHIWSAFDQIIWCYWEQLIIARDPSGANLFPRGQSALCKVMLLSCRLSFGPCPVQEYQISTRNCVLYGANMRWHSLVHNINSYSRRFSHPRHIQHLRRNGKQRQRKARYCFFN